MITRRQHMVETAIDTGVGLVASIAAAKWILPLVGVVLDLQSNIKATVVMTAVAAARSYVVRRGFHHLRGRRA